MAAIEAWGCAHGFTLTTYEGPLPAMGNGPS